MTGEGANVAKLRYAHGEPYVRARLPEPACRCFDSSRRAVAQRKRRTGRCLVVIAVASTRCRTAVTSSG